MSKKSTARTGSEGDANWNLSDLYPNVCSGSSTHRSTKDIDCCHTEGYPHICSGSSSRQQKKDIEGGPFGDTVHARKPPQTSDYVILMLQDDESNSSEDSDPELYSLRNDYIEKLNILRQRLNLVEFNSKTNDCRGGCRITEIHDEEPQASTSAEKNTEAVALCQTQQTEVEEQYLERISTHSSDTVEVETIHPFSLRFTADTKSITELFEVEYNPPKKKSCFRLQTPKLFSCSESNLPYHTKVSLHDGIFKPESQKNEAKEAERILKEGVSKFCSNKGVQCTEGDLGIPDDIVVINLTGESEEEGESSLSKVKGDIRASWTEESNSRTASPILAEELYYPIFGNREDYVTNRKVNRTCKVSSDSYDTGTTSGETPSKPSPLRHRYSHRNRVSPGKLTPSGGTKKLPYSKEFLANNSPDASGDKPLYQKRDLCGIKEEGIKLAKKKHIPSQRESYVIYSVTTPTQRVKSPPTSETRKTPVPFGPMIANNFEKSQPLEDRFNFYNGSDPSEDDKRFEEYYGVMESDASGSDSRNRGLWYRLFSCFRPIFGFLSKRR
nr:unnamed protein product [Callosobruchus analis]